MHAMHYEITLPADFPMATIRRRVETKGAALDAFAGLGLKAYLIRERGAQGSPVNQYAPFFLWNSVEGMNRFLWGDGFRGLSADLGRPSVQQWTGLGFVRGAAWSAPPQGATRQLEPLDPDADAGYAIEAAVARLDAVAAMPGLHSSALAIDTRRYELVHFCLWEGTAASDLGTPFEVLHVSAPELGEIPVGRHW
jgi:hypothetical protein